MRPFLVIVALLFATAGVMPVSAADERSSENKTQQDLRIRLCDYWTYSHESRTYTCDWLSRQVVLVEQRDLNPMHQAIRDLQQQVVELERRIRELELSR